MNLSTTRLTKRLKILDTAFLCNLCYLVLVLIFKGIQGLIGANGNYSRGFGIIEFLVVTFFWVVFNWIVFQKSGTRNRKVRLTYIVLNMAPAIIFTLISCIIIYLFPSYDFTGAWNQFSFAIAPTLFWYLPYGYLYYAFGFMMPLGLFMVLCLVFVFLAQVAGVMIGASQQLHEEERQKQIKHQQQKIARQRLVPASSEQKPRVSPVRRRDTVLEATAANHYEDSKSNNPFKDEDDTDQIIYTEAISTITDDMLEQSLKNRKNDTAETEAESKDETGSSFAGSHFSSHSSDKSSSRFGSSSDQSSSRFGSNNSSSRFNNDSSGNRFSSGKTGNNGSTEEKQSPQWAVPKKTRRHQK